MHKRQVTTIALIRSLLGTEVSANHSVKINSDLLKTCSVQGLVDNSHARQDERFPQRRAKL